MRFVRAFGKPALGARISLLKDLLVIALGGAIVAYILAVSLPGYVGAQAERLETRYYREQKTVLRDFVKSVAQREEALRENLLARSLDPSDVRGLLLDDLRHIRFGTGGSGYFFTMDGCGLMLEHPEYPELEGRDTRTIVNDDGVSLGDLFFSALSSGDAAYVEYTWRKAGAPEKDRKFTYLFRFPAENWVLGAGFYLSDLDLQVDAYRESSAELISASLRVVLLLMGLFVGFFLLLSAVANLSILRTERILTRRMGELNQYKRILDESSVVTRTDPTGKILYLNDAFTAVTGYSAARALGANQSIERHPDTPLETFRDMWSTIKGGKTWRGVIKNRKADGGWYYKRVTIVPIFDERGRIVEFISSGQDVTALIDSSRAVERAFQTDPLTGLGNRLRLLEDLAAEKAPWVALVDIEGFSGINQAFGPKIGDSILKRLGSVILDWASAAGVRSYRVYADTFALLGSLDGGKLADEAFADIRNGLASISLELNGERADIALRTGFADRGADSFVWADIALQQAKRDRKRAVVADESAEVPGGAAEHLRVIRAVREALEHDRVYPVFQPIAAVESREIVKYECLMRLEDEAGAVLPPDVFIPVSKMTEHYKRLTLRMIEKSIEAFADRKDQFSINFSIEDLLDEFIVTYLVSEAKRAGLQGRLFIEIVETEELKDFERALDILAVLREAGIGVAIDDFGSGYSSFEYLLRINPDYVKIDRAIVQALFSDDRAREMLVSIVGFAKKTGIKTIAEYIDSEELLAEMAKLGVDYAQGWLIGKASAVFP